MTQWSGKMLKVKKKKVLSAAIWLGSSRLMPSCVVCRFSIDELTSGTIEAVPSSIGIVEEEAPKWSDRHFDDTDFKSKFLDNADLKNKHLDDTSFKSKH